MAASLRAAGLVHLFPCTYGNCNNGNIHKDIKNKEGQVLPSLRQFCQLVDGKSSFTSDFQLPAQNMHNLNSTVRRITACRVFFSLRDPLFLDNEVCCWQVTNRVHGYATKDLSRGVVYD